MATIYDIAKRAGVSPATVSRVLNGYPDVSVKTIEKVREITAELGYKPNAVARGLATKRSMQIGVFFRDHVNSGFRHPFFQDVLAAFKDVVGARGFDLLFFANDPSDQQLMSFEARAMNRNVDGLLLLGVPREHEGLPALGRSKIPCMSIDLELIGARAGYLCSDNAGGAAMAVDYLVANGHREIAFVGDRLSTKPGHDRMRGFQEAVQKHKLPLRPDWIMDGDFTEESGYEAVRKLLDMTELPTAIFCAGDMMAIGAMCALREQGLTAGQEISVMGFDDISVSSLVTPQLTTIRQNRQRMGECAAQELLELIEDPTKYPPVITLETELVARQSVQPLNPETRARLQQNLTR